MRHLALLLILAFVLGAPAQAQQMPDRQELRAWVQAMKQSERGPFRRIRWFCEDGSVLPPEPSACKEHGGGSQHGEWSEGTLRLRDAGYAVANVYADLDEQALLAKPEFNEWFAQMLVEQFLIDLDDGWILRGARFYRGALQEEGERKGARRLLLAMAAKDQLAGADFALLRIAARLLRHGRETATVSEVRRAAAALGDTDAGFKNLRSKIHVRPEAADAAAVRDYAAALPEVERAPYLELAQAIDEAYTPLHAPAMLRDVITVGGDVELAGWLNAAADELTAAVDDETRFAVSARLLAGIRERLLSTDRASRRLALIDAGLALESQHFVAATSLVDRLPTATREQRLGWLRAGVEAVFGAGLASPRQRLALQTELARLDAGEVPLAVYKSVLDYLALLPGWGTQRLRYHFQEGLRRMVELEPKAELFIPDQLRGSPLFFVAANLDGLLRDANRLAGVRNELFGENVGAGLRSLNPGLARGTLHVLLGEHPSYQSDGIYLLPETEADLPPVAGILTAGEGNPLSHVQLLARNLGIPNVAVDASLVPQLSAHDGARVVLAVSPAGSVQLALDGEHFDAVFGAEKVDSGALIRPDLEKLDLTTRELLPLSRLRADDSGRTVGPKAAKLGELHHHYPEAVADGLAIPFGVFRALLDRPLDDTGQSVWDWMVGEYRRLEAMPAGSEQRVAETERFRARLEAWVAAATPEAALVERLRAAMTEVFGADGSYGVFVRSDTNVEDLPGFTGAGLNLTVANVVGVDAVLRAIPRVWASPFTARAFSWRQAHMDAPEHVYPAVLLLRSVPAQKSGVMVTQEVDTGSRDWLSVAVNEGVGGAVDGQAAESLRINVDTGEVRLMAQATAPIRRQVRADGGMDKIPASGADSVLEPDEIRQLIDLARDLPGRFPEIVDDHGQPAPADIEFGFLQGKLHLFQLRPFLESRRARGSDYLKSLDQGLTDLGSITVRLDAPAGEGGQ